jgi:hypothetical protein
MTIVKATVLKKHNSVWYGRGRVHSIDVSTGVAFLTMETGHMKGKSGGFDLSTLRFKIERRKEERS